MSAWQACSRHPNSTRWTPCAGCRDEQMAIFKRDLFDAVMDILPGPMKLVLRSKITKIVQLIVEAIQ